MLPGTDCRQLYNYYQRNNAVFLLYLRSFFYGREEMDDYRLARKILFLFCCLAAVDCGCKATGHFCFLASRRWDGWSYILAFSLVFGYRLPCMRCSLANKEHAGYECGIPFFLFLPGTFYCSYSAYQTFWVATPALTFII